jgi:hypothetical protein
MGCGSSKNAVRVIEPTESTTASKAVPKGEETNNHAPPPPPRELSLTPLLKIWVKYEDTWKRTSIMLSGWDQEDANTVEDSGILCVSLEPPGASS